MRTQESQKRRQGNWGEASVRSRVAYHLSTLTTKLMLWLHSPGSSKAGLTPQAQSSFNSYYTTIT